MKTYIVTIAIASMLSAGAFAAEPNQTKKGSPPSKELREQMAKAHEKMASCLRSEAPIQDCHEQMRKQCQDMKGVGDCPMMGQSGHGKMGK